MHDRILVSMRILRAVELCAWAMGAVLLARFGHALLMQHVTAAEEVQRFFVTAAAAQSKVLSGLPGVQVPDQTEWSSTRRAAYQASLTHSAPRAIAVLRVPVLRIEVPIYEGTSDDVLDRGAGWIPTTARVEDGGNIGIAAHRDSYFRALRHAAIGDSVELHTTHEVRRFRISYTRIGAHRHGLAAPD